MNVNLERITPDMARNFWEMAKDTGVAKFLPDFVRDYKSTCEMVDEFSKYDFHRNHAYMILCDNRPVGFLSAEYSREYGGFYTCCFTSKKSRGKGIMAKAINSLLDILESKGLEDYPLIFDISEDNPPSIRLAEKIRARKIKVYTDAYGKTYRLYRLYA